MQLTLSCSLLGSEENFPAQRLDLLMKMLQSKKMILALVTITKLPNPTGIGQGHQLSFDMQCENIHAKGLRSWILLLKFTGYKTGNQEDIYDKIRWETHKTISAETHLEFTES